MDFAEVESKREKENKLVIYLLCELVAHKEIFCVVYFS